MSIFQDETFASRRLTRKDYNALRNQFDGDDENVFRGMGIVAPRCAMIRYRPEQEDPQSLFLYNDAGTRAFLLQIFPSLESDERQRQQATQWAAVIYLYFRKGWPDVRIERELGWEKGKGGSVVQQIRRKIKGLRRNGKPYSTRKRGRPRKVIAMPVVEAPTMVTEQAA